MGVFNPIILLETSYGKFDCILHVNPPRPPPKKDISLISNYRQIENHIIALNLKKIETPSPNDALVPIWFDTTFGIISPWRKAWPFTWPS